MYWQQVFRVPPFVSSVRDNFDKNNRLKDDARSELKNQRKSLIFSA